VPDSLINLTNPTRPPAPPITLPALSYAPAAEAWTVVPSFADGERLCFIRRGDKRAWLPKASAAGLTIETLRQMADERNDAAGIPAEAAGALALDWSIEFKIPPTDPLAYADYCADEERLKLAKQGVKCRSAASAGWLTIVVATHGLPMNSPIRRGSIRHAWLTAHCEVTDWAEAHGRKTMRSLLPTERAALRVDQAARALHAASDAYRGYSREYAQFLLEQGDKAAHDRIRSQDRTERRALLLKLRADRRTLLPASTRPCGTTPRRGLLSAPPDRCSDAGHHAHLCGPPPRQAGPRRRRHPPRGR